MRHNAWIDQTAITAAGVIDTFLAATVALLLLVLGELLRALPHFSVASLSIAGGVILFVLAVGMVLGGQSGDEAMTAGRDPMQLARFPLAVPYLLNPVGIVGLVTIPPRLSRSSSSP